MVYFNKPASTGEGRRRASSKSHGNSLSGTPIEGLHDAYPREPSDEWAWTRDPVQGPFDHSAESGLGDAEESFETLSAEAQRLNRDDLELVKDILGRSAHLDELSVQRLLEEIKEHTGLTFETLNSYRKSLFLHSSGYAASSAEEFVDEYWSQGILYCEKGLYQWSDRGVWCPLSAPAFRSQVQWFLKLKGQAVTKRLVEDICYQIKNHAYVEGHQLDHSDENVINTLNGELTVDEDGIHRGPHVMHHYNITQIPVTYDPHADAPRFKAFLSEIFCGREEQPKSQAILEMMGYSLLRSTRLERFMILLGDGNNGKSVLMNVLQALGGNENVAAVQPSELERTFQRATLEGKLINIVTEVSKDTKFADGPIKAITSGERATVEHKNRDPFILRPYTTCWFAMNHLPKLSDDSKGIERRALIIKFDRSFARDSADMRLEEKLLEELPGILNLCLAAYSNALTTGFSVPDTSHAEMARWLGRDQSVELFIRRRCRIRRDEKTPSRLLHQAYSQWAEENGLLVVCTETKFVRRLKELGFAKGRSGSCHTIVGLSLLVDMDETGDVPVCD